MPNDLLMTARGFMASRIILTASELKIFDKLPATAGELAMENGWDAEAVTFLLNGLCAIEVLTKSKGKYKIADSLKDALSRDPEESILPMLEHFVLMWENWSELSRIVLEGRKDKKEIAPLADAGLLRSFIGAMHTIGRHTAKVLIKELKPYWATKILDVGGGSGTYTIAFLKEVRNLSATLFDLPGVIPMARERLSANGLIRRVSFVSGDFYQDPLPAGHDLVWLSAIIHQNGRSQNQKLFIKCYKALTIGGRLWIRDYIMDETRIKPPAGAIFAINMLVGTPAGSACTLDEVLEDLNAAGFTDAKMIRYGENMDCIVEAIKP